MSTGAFDGSASAIKSWRPKWE